MKKNKMKYFSKEKIENDFLETIHNYVYNSFYTGGQVFRKQCMKNGSTKYYCAIPTSLNSFVLSVMFYDFSIDSIYIVNLNDYIPGYSLDISVTQYDIASDYNKCYVYNYAFTTDYRGLHCNGSTILRFYNELIEEGENNNKKKCEAEKLSDLIEVDIKVTDIFDKPRKGYNMIHPIYFNQNKIAKETADAIFYASTSYSYSDYFKEYSFTPNTFYIVELGAKNNYNTIKTIYKVDFKEKSTEINMSITVYKVRGHNCFVYHYKNIDDDCVKNEAVNHLDYLLRKDSMKEYIDLHGKVVDIIGNAGNFIYPYKFNDKTYSVKISRYDFYLLMASIALLIVFLLMCLVKA